jgi:UDP-glucose 4-epimerase
LWQVFGYFDSTQEEIMKILVTGGAGFIGSNLCERLVQDGHEVIVYDNLLRGNKLKPEIQQQLTLQVADVRDKDTMKHATEGCDVIFHLAALLGVDIVADNPVETMDIESIGTRNVVECALENKVGKVLYASTSGIYGHSAIEKAVTEDIIVDPRTSYAIAKRYNEIYLAAHHEENNLQSVSLRFFNVYGDNQDERMVIPRFIEQALNDQPITVFGSGKQTRDFTHIDDTVEACVRLMEKVSGCEVFNIANEDEGCIGDLAVLIKELTGSKSEINYLDAPSKRYDFEVERRVGSSDKLLAHTGYKPHTTLREGLMEILRTTYGVNI